jgi:putative salt-induced outer membrane protein YdiY
MRTRNLLARLVIGMLAGSAAAEKIELANGDVLDGEVLERTADELVLKHEILGRLEIPTSQLSIATVKEGMFGTGFLRGWDRRLELGANGSDGNSDTLNVLGGLHLGFENDYHRFRLTSAYRLNEDEGDRTANNAFAEAVNDWLHPDRRWFPFVETRWDYDEFEDWDHRIAAGAGLGWKFYDTERFQLLGRAGLGASRTFGGEDERWVPEALLGLEGAWTIAENHKLTFYNKLYPDLDETGEFRNLSGLAWIIALNEELSLKLGAENEYESFAPEGTEKNDLRYTGSLLIGF